MESYDDISAIRLRRELVSFARLILTLEKHDALADRSASMLRILGELRRMVFAFEISHTDHDAPVQPRSPGWRATCGPMTDDEALDALTRESMRIVGEARRQERALADEFDAPADEWRED